MASDLSYAEYVRDQMRGAGRVSFRKMFGEYAIYCNEKVVALVCDNQCFVRPTAAGRAFLGSVTEGPPYPGAKPHFVVDELLEDQEKMAQLIQLTAGELPPKKPKKPKRQTAKAKSEATPKAKPMAKQVRTAKKRSTRRG